ncbi:MAG: cell wall hydrolase [Hyphomicrobiaceae bacterium]
MSRSRKTGPSHWLLLGVTVPGIALGVLLSVLVLSPSTGPLASASAVAGLPSGSITAAAFQPLEGVRLGSADPRIGASSRAKDRSARATAAAKPTIPAPRLAWTGRLTRTARTHLSDPLGAGFIHVATGLDSGGVAVPSLSASEGFSSAGYFLASVPFERALADEGEDLRPVTRGLSVDESVVLEKDGKRIFFGGLSEAEFRAKEKRCLATAIYFEARGESIRGQQAVAQVIMNRVRLNYYPNTICGVVYEGADRLNSCQFSFACDRKADVPRAMREWQIANEIAQDTIDGKIWLPEVGTASHYHATYVSPRWTSMMKRTTRIGVHVFYRGKFLGPVDIASSGEDPGAHVQ